MENSEHNVEFYLCGLSNSSAKSFLFPEGSIVFQYFGLPYSVGQVSCFPIGPVGVWSRNNVTELDRQWYKRTNKLEIDEIPKDTSKIPKVKDQFILSGIPKNKSYLISSLTVNGTEVQVIAVHNKIIEFRRLGHAVHIDLRQIDECQRFTFVVEWSMTHLEARVTWLEGGGLESFFPGTGIQFTKNKNYTEPRVGKVIQFISQSAFDINLMPAEVTKAIWNTSKDLIKEDEDRACSPSDFSQPRRFYIDEEDLFSTVQNILQRLIESLEKCQPSAFWNNKTPKSEPESGKSLRFFLESLCNLKNLKIEPESNSASGNVDFSIIGTSRNHDFLEMILELKNAHSASLSDGLTKQLPTYLKERRINKSIYLVLWYKCSLFEKPAKYTFENCEAALNAIKPESVSEVIVLDLSYKTQASKL